MKLNIGCWRKGREGFVGVDIVKYPAVDVIAPAHDLPYEDNSIEAIYSSHMIEHVSDPLAVLREWFRVLMPGGRLTVRCPNLVAYVFDWLNADYEERWNGVATPYLFGWTDLPTHMRHKTGFSLLRLSDLIREAGFFVRAESVVPTRDLEGPEYHPKGDLLCQAVKSNE